MCYCLGCILNEDTDYTEYITNEPIPVANLQECANKCGERSECKYWIFNSKALGCDLSPSHAERIPNRPGRVTGDKTCGMGEHFPPIH